MVNTLKRRILDYLAKVLAKFKMAKDPRVYINGNYNIQYIASMAIIKDFNYSSIMIFCSKNKGLNSIDKTFLEKLKALLEIIAKNDI